ncbi:hypothetical protein [Aurantibacillus circumpalustris]|uniref:hypothetical protein n=1 Tax=Aurantibacillus circumpalustris TaxID=3036359 RepID=UPI00295BF084|nr:hypothetical protein [Aurantibacillus circumpalustris]
MDSILYMQDKRLQDGIYLSYQDFRMNKSLRKEQIVSTLDKDQLEFLTKVVYKRQFSYKENEETINVETETVWGYMQNNTFYINYEGEFRRVPVFGSISYFIATLTVQTPGFYDPRFGGAGGSTTRTIISELIMNYYDGSIKEFNQKNAEDLLEPDKTLYDEYKKLSKRKQKEQMYTYIRKYNTAHPIYFLQ